MDEESELRIVKVTQATAPLPEFILDDPATLRLYVNDTVINGIRRYCGGDADRELGGILLGRHFQTGERHLVEVSAFRPLHSSDRGKIHFKFEAETLLGAWKEPLPHGVERIGWFHSHPKLGDPFMSGEDVALHKSYFSSPWHVSCVVATGEWALPMGFWRIAGGQLMSIESHYVHMSVAKPVGEQSRRFLGSCRSGDVSIDGALAELKAAVADLGGAQGTSTFDILREVIDSDLRNGADLVSTEGLGALLRLGVSVNERLKDRVDIDTLARQLNQYRDFDRSATQVILSSHLVGQLIVMDQKCLTLNAGGRELCKGDLSNNVIVPLRLRHPAHIRAGAMTSGGDLYIAMSDGSLLKFEFSAADSLSLGRPGEQPRMGIIKIADGKAPLQIAVDDTYIYARSEDGIYRTELAVAINPAPAINLATPMVRNPQDGTILLLGGMFAQNGRSVMQQGDMLWLIDGNGAQMGSKRLESGLADAELVQACDTNAGIALLFNRGETSVVEILQPVTLERRFTYRARPESKWSHLTEITSDAAGRLFMKSAATIGQIL